MVPVNCQGSMRGAGRRRGIQSREESQYSLSFTLWKSGKVQAPYGPIGSCVGDTRQEAKVEGGGLLESICNDYEYLLEVE